MAWRKWFVRTLVFGIAGVCACAGYVYRYWTNPAAVRRQVTAMLASHFPGALITLDGARMSLLGGIVLNDLHLARADDPDQVDFLHVPSATIYHDKEKLLDGTLSIRRMELDHARVRLVRERDGRWNLAGVARLAEPDVPLPTLVVHEGTLILDDRLEGGDLPPVEITHVNLNFINDPLSIVQIDGRGHSQLFGELEIHGTRNRQSDDLSLKIQAEGMTVTPALLQRMARRCPTGSLDNLNLQGHVDLVAELTYAPAAEPAFGYDVHMRLVQGKLEHPSVPLPLDNIDATLHCRDGRIHLKDFKAQSGRARVWGRGSGGLPCPECDFEGVVEVKHLELRPGLFEKLPKQFRKLEAQFKPAGPATLRIACARKAGEWTTLSTGDSSTVALQPENSQATFDKFPYPLKRVSGALELDLTKNLIHIDILAHAGTRPVSIKGTWAGKDEQVDAAIEIRADNVPLDETLLSALRPTPFHDLARSFHARGKGDIKALIRHIPGAPPRTFANEYHVFFHDTEVDWEHFPYHLAGVSGVLDVFDGYPKHLEFYNFRGRHGDSTVFVHGRTTPETDANHRADKSAGSEQKKPRLIVAIQGKDVALDADLGQGMQAHPVLFKTWQTLAPSGRADFTALIDRLRGPATEAEVLRDLSVNVEMKGGTITPQFFPYALSEVASKFRYHHDRVALDYLSGRHGEARINVGASTIDLHVQGGLYADVKQLRAHGLSLDADFTRALPAPLKDACTAMDVKNPLVLQTDLIVSVPPEPGGMPDIYWDGQAWLKNTRLRAGLELSEVTGTLACRGRSWRGPKTGPLLALNGNFRLDQAVLAKQPFHDVHGDFHVREQAPDALVVGLQAPLFGGDIAGELRAEMNSSATRYQVNLTASQIDLQEFGRYNMGSTSKLKGLAGGRLFLSGKSSGVDSLEGTGQIEIPRGHIYPYNVPLLGDLLKILGLRTPERTMFDEANALFKINGQRVKVERLELLGTAISLYGHGDFKLETASSSSTATEVKLDFYPSWGRVEQLMPEVLRSIPAEIGKQMLKIEARGQVGPDPGELRFTKKPIPALFYIRDRVVGNQTKNDH